jgi:hypothetical protein
MHRVVLTMRVTHSVSLSLVSGTGFLTSLVGGFLVIQVCQSRV